MTKIHLFWIAQNSFLKDALLAASTRMPPPFFHILKSSNSLEQISTSSHLRFFTNMENTAPGEFSVV